MLSLRRSILGSFLSNSKAKNLASRRRSNRRRQLMLEKLDMRLAMAGDTVTIFAAGATNQETMQLLIDGNVVQTWNNVGGNVSTPSYVAYSYVSNTTLSPDRIRVAFTNDLYNPPTVDRNLRVDRIQINSTTYETEAPTVYSTGTWAAADGVQPGFRQSEFLHTNGYLQYAVNNGSTIQVLAAGWTGNENIELQIDGRTVFGWNGISGNPFTRQFTEYTYRAAGTVTADRIRVAFTNDLYLPPSTDYNVTVDKIIVDGVEFETESPTTLSTGTYDVGQGAVVTGYWQSEMIHSNGYFQYLARAATPGNLGLETSVYSVQENTANVTVAVVRTGGSDGTVGITFRTNDGTALNTSDYSSRTGTLSFGPGETRKTVSIPIINNTTNEAPETFSFVIENPTGGATLLAPRTATITITDDDLLLPNFTSFPSSTGLRLNGSASITSSTLQLTPATANQAGTAYYATPIPINIDTSFQTQFQLRATGGTNGGDGMAFVIQNSTSGLTALGPSGGGLGYSGIGRSLAIEFDTYQNSGEVNNNHISIWRDGNLVSSLATKASGIDFNSGSPVYVWVDYNGDSDLMAIFLATTNTKPTTPFQTVSADLSTIVGTQAFFGFSGGTGGIFNAHQVQNWRLTLNRPTVAPPTPVVNLVQETVVSGLTQPIAAQFSSDGRNLYVAEKSGLVRVVRDGVMQTTPFVDIRGQVNDVRDRGLLDIAIHPNFASNPYIYLLFTYDPPQVNQNTSHALAGPDKPGNRAGRLIRVTANSATNFTTAVAGSEVVLLGTNSTWTNFNAFINSTFDLNAPQAGLTATGAYVQDFIPSDSESHTVGSLAFAPDGSLYVSIGDGASYNSVDARATRVQDVDSLSGKLLRINPINGQGYANNPFATSDLTANRSKVYQSGLRNPFRISVDSTSGQLFIGDVGWTQWEEINSAGPGANFGWPYYEGGSGSNLQTNGYKDLAKAQTFYASGAVATPATYALNHAADGINAIVMGAAYTGTTYPAQYRNNVFFNDLGQGIVRAATLDTSGRVINVETFTTGAVYVVQIFQGRDGNLYFVDLDSGFIGRWVFVPQATATTSGTTAARTAAPTTSSLSTAPATTSSFSTAVAKPSGAAVNGTTAALLGKGVFQGVGASNQRGKTVAGATNIATATPPVTKTAITSTSVVPTRVSTTGTTMGTLNNRTSTLVQGPLPSNNSNVSVPAISSKPVTNNKTAVTTGTIDEATLNSLARNQLRSGL